MADRIRPDRELLTEIHRAAAEQATKARADLTHIDADGVVAAVHDARKRCKKIRGLARLVRPALGDRYRTTNEAFREAARALSPHRDAQALLDTFDRLVSVDAERLPPGGLGVVRGELAARSRHSIEAFDRSHESVEQALGFLSDGVEVVDSWSLDCDGWSAIGAGLHKTYARGVDALAIATDDGSSEDFHELRKRAKYTWYHVRLLETTAPSILRPLAARLHELSDALGDAHDLSVLTALLRREHEAFGGATTVDAAVSFFDERRRDLEGRSLGLAHRLYVESPKRFSQRLGAYWVQHGRWGDERAVGGIDDVAPNSTTDDFDEMSVKELQTIARDADLAGRSSMVRDDLVASLRAAGVGRSLR
ncbi:CHAD domain-containing protein [Ilumatobacter sp.]|uniref:CHAD domain-containing protein n=1 Tax=Ilumatobacter sp. TaxID=1967498 RepID=UPI003C3D7CE8